MFVHDFLRKHLLEGAGIFDDEKPMQSWESLMKTEWSTKFERLMRNRLIMGAFRYGLLKAPGKVRYDRVASIKKRLDLFVTDGNAEHLVDIANLCLLEFEEPNHPKFHFNAQDDKHHTLTL